MKTNKIGAKDKSENNQYQESIINKFYIDLFFVKDIHLGLFSSQLKSNSIKCAWIC